LNLIGFVPVFGLAIEASVLLGVLMRFSCIYCNCTVLLKAVRSVAPTFIATVRGGDVEEVERLLGQGGWGLVNALYLEGRLSPLMVAAERGDMPMAELLMRHGARPELEKDPMGHEEDVTTALSLATKAGHEDMAKYLLAKGEWAPHGAAMKEVLLAACQYGRVALLSEYLSRLQYHEKTWLEGLKRAWEGGHGPCLDLLLQYAEQSSRRGLIDRLIKHEWLKERRGDGIDGEPFNSVVLSCLKHLGPGEPDLAQPHWAKVATLASASSSRFPALKQLLEQGVNTHSAIRQALLDVLGGHEDARPPSKLLCEDRLEDRIARTRYLLSMGVGCGLVIYPSDCRWDTNTLRLLMDSGSEFVTAGILEILAENGKLEELALLLERAWGCCDSTLRAALFAAAGAGMEDAVALLLQHGVKGEPLGRQDRHFYTADVGGESLFKACSRGHRGVVRRLIEWGSVDVCYKPPMAKATALGKCVEKGDWRGAVLLLGAGACLDAANMRCMTPVDVMEVDEAVPSTSAAEWNSIVEVSVVIQ
jgi:hypothetical protein